MDITDFPEKLCRLCLMPTPSTLLYGLDHANQEYNFISKINKLVGKNIVSNNDGLLQEVCKACVTKVNSAHDFIKNIVTNHEKLKYLTIPVIKSEMEEDSSDYMNDTMEYHVQYLPNDSDDYEKYTILVKEENDQDEEIDEDKRKKQEDRHNKEIAIEDITSIGLFNDDGEDGDDDFYNTYDEHLKIETIINDDDNAIIEENIIVDDDNDDDDGINITDNDRAKQRPPIEHYLDDYFTDYSITTTTTTTTNATTTNTSSNNNNNNNTNDTSYLYTNRMKFVLFEENGKPSDVDLNFDDYDRIDAEVSQFLSSLKNDRYQLVRQCRRCKSLFVGEGDPYSHLCNDTVNNDTIYNDGTDNEYFVPLYMCTYCKQIFASLFLLALHADQHRDVEQQQLSTDITSYTCVYCNFILENETNLKKHVRTLHKAEYVSRKSDTTYYYHNNKNKNNRNNHNNNNDNDDDDNNNNNNSGDGVYVGDQCDVCGKITNRLEQHKLFHVIENLEIDKIANKQGRKTWHTCDQCGKKIPTEYGLLFHKAEHRNETHVTCEQCGYRSDSLSEYAVHHSNHTGERTYVCNDCQKCFQTRSAISDHVLLHMEGMRYMCEMCGKRFKTCRAHAQHKLLQHRRYLRCVKCNRGFSNAEKMRTHYEICLAIGGGASNSSNRTKDERIRNDDNDNFNTGGSSSSSSSSKSNEAVQQQQRAYCNICRSYIKSNSDITMLFHYAKHEGKEGIRCTVCDVMCKNVYAYKNHTMIHSEERPFCCLQCDKRFRTKGCLVQHMLVHGNDYKYTCDYCGKKSKKLTTHINHVNIHTDTRPYSCPDCSRPFRQLSDMKKHRKTHLKTKHPVEQNVLAAGLAFVPISLEMKEELMNADNVIF